MQQIEPLRINKSFSASFCGVLLIIFAVADFSEHIIGFCYPWRRNYIACKSYIPELPEISCKSGQRLDCRVPVVYCLNDGSIYVDAVKVETDQHFLEYVKDLSASPGNPRNKIYIKAGKDVRCERINFIFVALTRYRFREVGLLCDWKVAE